MDKTGPKMPNGEKFDPKKFWVGMPMPFWGDQKEYVTKFVSETGLMPVKNLAELGIDKGYCGGIRVPHLHLENDLYLLSKNQETEFTKNFAVKVQESVASSKTINFVHFLESMAPKRGP